MKMVSTKTIKVKKGDNSNYIRGIDKTLSVTVDEKIEIIAKRILKKHISAFKELAK